MKKLITIICSIFLSVPIFAATYDGSAGRVIGTRAQHVTSGVTVGAGDLLVYDALNVVGTATHSGATTLTGATTQTGTLTSAGKIVKTPVAHAALSVTTQVSLTSAFMIVASSGGAVISTAAPLISTATATNPNGTTCILMGSSDTDIPTVIDSATFALGAATRALGVGDILELIIYNGIWYEVGFTNN